MDDNLLLLCSPSDRLFRSLAKALVPCGNRLQQMHDVLDASECIEAIAPSAILVDLDEYPEAIALIKDFGSSTPVIALTRGSGHEHWNRLLCSLGTPFVVAIPSPEAGAAAWRPLAVAIEKIHRRDFFGLDKYVSGFGVELNHVLISSAGQREEVLDTLADKLVALHFPTRLIHSIRNGADELITNAVYNAPRDEEGQPRYAHLSREHKVVLHPRELVELQFASDGLRFGLAVRDRFGALDFAGFRKGMRRCINSSSPINQGAGGAGLGLYMLARSCQTLIFNVRSDQATEIIALWDPRPRENLHNSIYFFEEERYAQTERHPQHEVSSVPTLDPLLGHEDTKISPPLLFDAPGWDDTTNRMRIPNRRRHTTNEETNPSLIN